MKRYYLTAYDGYGEGPIGGLADVQGWFDSVEDAVAWHVQSDFKFGEVFSIDPVAARIVVHAYTDGEDGSWIREESALDDHADIGHLEP